MAQPSFKASAPGSLIIMGEYAVLHGYPAAVAAIDRKITATLTPRDDHLIKIASELGELTTSIKTLQIEPPFDYVLTALKQAKLSKGVTITIKSEFSSQMGLGSSAAVTVATIACLHQWLGRSLELPDLFNSALRVIYSVQNKGSGADIAASLYGGVIRFEANPFSVKTLPTLPDLNVFYSGSKTTTTQALQSIKAQQQQNPSVYKRLFDRLGELSLAAVSMIEQQDWVTLGMLFNHAQHKLAELGVCTSNINRILQTLSTVPTISGAKISGSGLGDCVIALGQLKQNLFPNDAAGVLQLDLQIGQTGLRYDH